MARYTLPPIELLRELFDYSPETGELRYKKRPPEFFSRACMCDSWNRANAGKLAHHISKNGYLRVRVYKIDIPAHRVIFALMTGREPSAEIDHINRNKADNRWSNLREATRSENSVNSGPHNNNALGVRGVSKFQMGNYIRYVAEICMKGKRRRLGYFLTVEEASDAYKRAADEMHGEFAYHRNPNQEGGNLKT